MTVQLTWLGRLAGLDSASFFSLYAVFSSFCAAMQLVSEKKRKKVVKYGYNFIRNG